MFHNLFKETYSGKKIFLTGHTGFKGSWLLQWLHLLGAEVKGFSLAPEREVDLYHLIKGDELCESVIADIRDQKVLEEELLRFEPDFIFHLAAQPLVRLSYEMPVDTFAINAIGTAHILEATRKLQKPCVVVLITTDKVYENKEWIYPYRETDSLGGYDPYSASKACAEIVIQSYTQSFFSTSRYEHHRKVIASARAGNVIGGGDWSKDRIIPDIVKALHADKPVIIRNPTAVRPWQHVLEPLGGYLLLGSRLAADPVRYAGAWNFGPLAEDNKQVEDIVFTSLQIWGTGTYEKPALANQPHEAGLLKLDISKARTQLDWMPRYDSSTAIRNTICWYKKFFEDNKGIRDYTVQQILSYSTEPRTAIEDEVLPLIQN